MALATTSSAPRSSISTIRCHRIPCSRIHSKVSRPGQYPRRPSWTKLRPSTHPSSMSRRIGVPCDSSAPHTSVPVSACASKCTRPIRRGRCVSATAATAGYVIE